jgi:hypothetical protein
MKEALRALDKENWNDDIRVLIALFGATEEDISRAVKSITDAHMMMISDVTVKTAEEALRVAGWYEHPACVRYLIYSRLGEVMLGGFFLAIRDVRMIGSVPPHAREIGDFIAEGLRVAGREEEYIKDAFKEEEGPPSLASACTQWRLAMTALAESQMEVQVLSRRCAGLERVVKGANQLAEYINNLGLWSGICRAISVWWRGRKSPTPTDDSEN